MLRAITQNAIRADGSWWALHIRSYGPEKSKNGGMQASSKAPNKPERATPPVGTCPSPSVCECELAELRALPVERNRKPFKKP